MKSFDVATWQDDAELIHAFKQEVLKQGISQKELFRRMWKLWKEKKEEKNGNNHKTSP